MVILLTKCMPCLNVFYTTHKYIYTNTYPCQPVIISPSQETTAPRLSPSWPVAGVRPSGPSCLCNDCFYTPLVRYKSIHIHTQSSTEYCNGRTPCGIPTGRGSSESSYLVSGWRSKRVCPDPLVVVVMLVCQVSMTRVDCLRSML